MDPYGSIGFRFRDLLPELNVQGVRGFESGGERGDAGAPRT